jgi:hypothetical protein
MGMGLTDYLLIAAAAGLTVEEVERIDRAEDPIVRQLCLEGLPRGDYFPLHRKVRCPRCAARITMAPCVRCDLESAL